MQFVVLTIFPEMFDAFWAQGIIRRALSQQTISASTINIRDFARGKHRNTDDRPFGGGAGMVMKPDPLAAAIQEARQRAPCAATVLMTPQGRVFDQALARNLSLLDGLILVCGRYEGIDERIPQAFVDYELSIGDYVLTGGELPSMVVMDAVTRLVPGALGGLNSAQQDSFSKDLLEYAQYTRPRSFEGMDVPKVLLNGHHGDIEDWRLESALIRTFLKRKDLLLHRRLSIQEMDLLKKWCRDIERIIEDQSLHGVDPLSCDE